MSRAATSPADNAQVLVVGASIGGLSAALTLHAQGIDATLIDAADVPQRLHAGMTLQPHAVREIHELGLGEELAAHGVATTSVTYYTDHGDPLHREPRGIDGGYGFPQYEVNRATLLTMLQHAVDDRLGPDATRTGTRLASFHTTPTGMRAHTSTGDITTDILVGADGLHSTIRAQLHPQDGPVQWSGTRMFRGTTHHPPFLDGLTLAIIKGAHGVDLIAYPIGDGVISWVLMVPVAGPGPLPADTPFNAPVDCTQVLPHVAEWNVGWLDVTDLITSSQAILQYPQVDRDPLPHWGSGGVTLLGDAAHPMYPLGGNGGSQAIVDARVLAEELATGVTHVSLRRYEHRRRAVTADVVTATRAMRDAASTNPDALARATERYRLATHADDTATASATTMNSGISPLPTHELPSAV